MEVNPFYHSGPVIGDNFADRQDELNTLLRWLGTTPPACIALYGPERIGKTSLLRQLCEIEGPKRYGNYRWLYLDMQGIFSPDEFFEELKRKLGGSSTDIRAILEQSGSSIVLCLDEFGEALSRPEFTADFYDYLRSLTQTGKLALVISTLRPLRELSVPSKAEVSRFFNIFRPFELGPFSPDAARELLTSRGLSEEEANWILKNVREPNHPYHLQLLGAYLYEIKQAGRPREEALRKYQQALEWEKGPVYRQVVEKGARPSGWDTAGMAAMALSMLLLVFQVFYFHPLLIWLAAASFGAALIFWLIDRLRRRADGQSS
jgi:GTPase SAR1 family protein